MPFNIKNFSTHVKTYGTLQTNRYEVSMNIPSILLSSDNFNPFQISNRDVIQQHINFRAEQVRIPGIDIQTIENMPQGVGVVRTYPTHARFTDPSITFIDNGNNDLYKFFYSWKNSMIDYNGFNSFQNNYNPEPSYEVAYKNTYETDMIVDIYDNNGNKRTNIKFLEIFPKSLNDTSLSWSENNSLFKVTVTFKISRWLIERNLSNAFIGVEQTNEIITLGPGRNR